MKFGANGTYFGKCAAEGAPIPPESGILHAKKRRAKQPDIPRYSSTGIPLGTCVTQRHKTSLTNQRPERGSNVKLYSGVPLRGAESWRYAYFRRCALQRMTDMKEFKKTLLDNGPIFNFETYHDSYRTIDDAHAADGCDLPSFAIHDRYVFLILLLGRSTLLSKDTPPTLAAGPFHTRITRWSRRCDAQSKRG